MAIKFSASTWWWWPHLSEFLLNHSFHVVYLQEVVRLETQYWALVELPKQDKQEPVPAYVLRACATLEKTQKPGEGVKTSAKLAEEDEKRRERLERLESKLPFVRVSDISVSPISGNGRRDHQPPLRWLHIRFWLFHRKRPTIALQLMVLFDRQNDDLC
jgi:hypothetical protein